MITPLADRIVIEPSKPESISQGGIIIPDMAKKNQNIGTVVAVGTGILHDESTDLYPGDKVLFEANAGTEYDEAGKKYRIVRKMNVLIKYN